MAKRPTSKFVFTLSAPRVYPFPNLHYAPPREVEGKRFTAVYQDISDETAQHVLDIAEAAYDNVVTFLGPEFRRNRGRFKRPTEGVIPIVISENFVRPEASQSPRGIKIPSRYLSQRGCQTGPVFLHGRGPTIWHNVTNILYAEAAKDVPDPSWHQLFNDGLGGYVQAELGGGVAAPWPSASYPTMGKEVHYATAQMIAMYGVTATFTEAAQAMAPLPHSIDRRRGWLIAASFVKFLVEENKESFARWYYGEASFVDSFGAPVDARQKWLDRLAKIAQQFGAQARRL